MQSNYDANTMYLDTKLQPCVSKPLIVQAQAWLVLADGYWIYVQVEVCQFLPLHFLVWFDEAFIRRP